MTEQLNTIVEWINLNQGIVGVGIFVLTILLGWVSGIFTTLRRKPKLRFRLIEGPSFVCTFGTGAKYEEFDVHRTCFALYLDISNVGSAPTSIDTIWIGYRWAILPFKPLWWKYGLRRFWISEQTVALEDFQSSIGESQRLYPFLTQRSSISGDTADTFLEIGKSTNGVAYFEQTESWGACFPVSYNHKVNLKVRIVDVFGRRYTKKFVVDRVTLEEARKFNPSFGLTYAAMNVGQEPFDLPQDANGNLLPPDD